jgi:hypothetical protein
MIIKINDKNYNIVVWNNPLKKYDVYYKDKKIFSFGAKGYEHYKDRIGYYKDYDHLDNKRRELYYKRHNKKYNIISPDWFAKMFLW